jgi:hypothetical protein
MSGTFTKSTLINSIPYYKVHSRSKRKTRNTRNTSKKCIRASLFDDTGITSSIYTSSVATFSKTASLVVTFPLESCKIYAQMRRDWNKIQELYEGFLVVLITSTMQTFINFSIFFGILNAMSNMPLHNVVLYASCISCLVTSFIKVPLTFLNKNILFSHGMSTLDAIKYIYTKLTFETYKKCWFAITISDIPDILIKTALNYIILYNHPTCDYLLRNCIITVSSSIFSAPLDLMLTRTFCKMHNKVFKNVHYVMDSFIGLRYRIISNLIGQYVFYNIFSVFCPSQFY